MTVLNIYWFIVILSVVFSWLFNLNIINYHNPVARSIYDFVYRLTEPVFQFVRSFLPNLGPIDISPIVVLLLISFLQVFVARDLAPLLVGG